jgi:hypothetical protein
MLTPQEKAELERLREKTDRPWFYLTRDERKRFEELSEKE